MTRAQALQRLQQIDSELLHLRSELTAAESLLRADPALERRRASATAALAAQAEAQERAREAEAAMNALDSRVRTLDRRLYSGSVHNPNELLTMQRELEVLRVELSAAESRAVELLEAAEETDDAARDAERELQVEEERRRDALQPLRERALSLRQQLEEVQQRRDSIAQELPASDLSLYSRVAGHHQPAVVPLAGDACSGCHLPISVEERRLVRTGDGITQCSNCDRILVP